MSFGGLLHLELQKGKGTLAWALAFVAPWVVTLLNFFVFLKMGDHPSQTDASTWAVFFQQTYVFWGILMLPLFVTLETSLLAALEHQEGHWKQVLIQPVRRSRLHLAKLITGLFLLAASLVSLWVSIFVMGTILGWIKPEYGFTLASLPWSASLYYLGLSLVASFWILSLHHWAALRWRGHVTPLALGIAATVAGFIIIQSDYRFYYPWALPGVLLNGFSKGEIAWQTVAWGGLGGLLCGVAAVVHLSRREMD